MNVGIFEQIDLAIYPFDIWVSIGQSDDEFLLSIIDNDLILPSTFIEDSRYYAKTWQAGEGYTIFRIKEYPECSYHVGAIAHDSFHSTLNVMRTIGAALNDGSEEPYAYLLGFIVSKIDELIEKRLMEICSKS